MQTYNYEEIFHEVSEYAKSETGIDSTKVRKIRRSSYVNIRAAIIVSMTHLLGIKRREMGDLLGKDHTTICYHLSMHSHRYRHEEDYADTYDLISKKVAELGGRVEIGTDVNKILGLIKETLAI